MKDMIYAQPGYWIWTKERIVMYGTLNQTFLEPTVYDLDPTVRQKLPMHLLDSNAN